jgi:hypothetical protein
MQILGEFPHDPATVVFAHFPDESRGGKRKSDDFIGGYCCNICHAIIDGRCCPSVYGAHADEYLDNKEFYLRRSQNRTMRRLIEKGVIKICNNHRSKDE